MKIPNANTARRETVVGLEVHIRLATATKAFCRCESSFGERPNSHVCPVCLGYPGALPVVNREMVGMALSLALATGSVIHHRTRFARKHYFYPDLPKGYQITQYETPLCTSGIIYTDVLEHRFVELERIHLEEDAAVSHHSSEGTLVDFNRCGAPLLEVVTKPVIRQPSEAGQFLHQLRRLVRYLGISDGDMEKGSLRCDANISLIAPDTGFPGDLVEIKNLNSIRGVVSALGYEAERQEKVYQSGQTVRHETRLWNEDKRRTFPMRGKEEISDYRYFPEPDLGELVITDEWIEKARSSLPELPHERLLRYSQLPGLKRDLAEILTEERGTGDYFDRLLAAVNGSVTPVEAASWVSGEVLHAVKETNVTVSDLPLAPERLAGLIWLVHSGRLSRSAGKAVFVEMLESGAEAEELMTALGLEKIRDGEKLRRFAVSALDAHPGLVQKFRSGKSELFGFFMGEAMKLSGGAADPVELRKILEELLGQ